MQDAAGGADDFRDVIGDAGTQQADLLDNLGDSSKTLRRPLNI